MAWIAIGLTMLTVCLVLLAGLPLVTRVADAHLRTRAISDERAPVERMSQAYTTKFAPLDLGPDTMTWPSESDRGTPYADALSWPSTHWGDDAFGKNESNKKAEASIRATEARREQATARRAAEGANDAGATKAVARPAQPAPVTAKAKAKAPGEPTPGVPSHDEVKALIRSKGLAGTVRHLTQTTPLSLEQVTELILRVRG